MIDPGFRREISRGLGILGRYLLSHHEAHEHHRCYRLVLRGRPFHICSRCSGIYTGMLAGLIMLVTYPQPWMGSLLVIALVPLPAVIDWTLYVAKGWRGNNAVRTITGLGVGFGYILGLHRVFTSPSFGLFMIAVIYALVVAGMVWYKRGN